MGPPVAGRVNTGGMPQTTFPPPRTWMRRGCKGLNVPLTILASLSIGATYSNSMSIRRNLPSFLWYTADGTLWNHCSFLSALSYQWQVESPTVFLGGVVSCISCQQSKWYRWSSKDNGWCSSNHTVHARKLLCVLAGSLKLCKWLVWALWLHSNHFQGSTSNHRNAEWRWHPALRYSARNISAQVTQLVFYKWLHLAAKVIKWTSLSSSWWYCWCILDSYCGIVLEGP